MEQDKDQLQQNTDDALAGLNLAWKGLSKATMEYHDARVRDANTMLDCALEARRQYEQYIATTDAYQAAYRESRKIARQLTEDWIQKAETEVIRIAENIVADVVDARIAGALAEREEDK